MTVPATSRRAGPYNGNGSTTTFSFSFKTFDADDLLVTRTASGVDTTLVKDSDYSVTLNGDQDANPGGSITYPISGSALASGQSLTIIGDLPYEQTTDLLGGGAFNARVIEDTFDRTVVQIQQLKEVTDRALIAPIGLDADATLPYPEASKVIGWNEAGDGLQNYDASAFAGVVAYGTANADVFTGNGSTTAFTLSASPATINNLDVAIDGVTQYPTTDYTWSSGTTLTFTSAPANGAKILVRYAQALALGNADAASTQYLPSGTGAVATTVQSKLRETVSVKDFGAVGDGVTDDTAEIQAAIDYCLANAKALYVPTGKYRLTAQVNIPVYSGALERDLIIHGEGMGSQFIVDHAGTGFYVTCLPSYATYQAEFRDLYFTTGTTSPDKIIHNVGAINTLIRDCHFRSATVGTGCVVNDNAYGLTLQGCVFWEITGTCAFYALVADTSTYSYVNSIIDCEFSIVTMGVEMQGCNAFLVSNTVFQECDVGFYANPVSTQVTAFNITFDTCWFERNTTWDIQLDSDLNYWCEATIRNCQFAGFPPTFQCKIQLEQKSKVTIEGTPSGNTVVVHGANDAAAVLIRATNFVQSGVFAWTSIDPVGNIVAAAAKVEKLYSGIAYNPGRRINTQAGAGETAAYIGGVNSYVLIDNVGGGNNFYQANTLHEFQGAGGAPSLLLNGATRIVSMPVYGAGTATFNASGTISSVSDETWKTKDGAPSDPVGMLKAIEPGYWYYNEEKKEEFGKDRQLGFYAQNIHAAIGPEAAPTPEEGKPWGYYDRSVLAVVVMALQNALKRVETLESEISKLKGIQGL